MMMQISRYCLPTILALLSVLAAKDVDAGHIYYGRSTTCNRGCLQRYRYQHDDEIVRNKVLAVAEEASDANLLVRIENTTPTQRKRFPVKASEVRAGAVGLETIGLVVYDSGEAILTGTLTHDGGPDGGLQGNRVRIRVRAYAGVIQGESVADAVVVWQNSYSGWVSKNQPTVVRFGTEGARIDQLQRFFPAITHLELEVQCIRDR